MGFAERCHFPVCALSLLLDTPLSIRNRSAVLCRELTGDTGRSPGWDGGVAMLSVTGHGFRQLENHRNNTDPHSGVRCRNSPYSAWATQAPYNTTHETSSLGREPAKPLNGRD